MIKCAGKCIQSNWSKRGHGLNVNQKHTAYYRSSEVTRQGNAFWKAHWENRDRLRTQRNNAVTFALIDENELLYKEVTTNTLYGDLLLAGIQVDHHESDLYFPCTAKSAQILKRFPELARSATLFEHNATRAYWYDVPFAYLPYWESKAR